MEWTHYPSDLWEAKTPFDTFYVIEEEIDHYLVYHEMDPGRKRFSLEKAKAWAEEDMMERARKCLLT